MIIQVSSQIFPDYLICQLYGSFTCGCLICISAISHIIIFIDCGLQFGQLKSESSGKYTIRFCDIEEDSLPNTYPTALGMNYNQSTLTGGYFGVVSRNVVIEDDQQEE